MFIAQAYSDVFTDVVILSLPVPNTWTLHVPVRHKLAISLVFLLGALTICTGIAKVVVFYDVIAAADNVLTTDITYICTPIVYWSMIESALGIVGACLPLMRPLVAGTSSSGFMRSLRSIVWPSSAQSASSGGTERNSTRRRQQANKERMDAVFNEDAWKRFGSQDGTLYGSIQTPSPALIQGPDISHTSSPRLTSEFKKDTAIWSPRKASQMR